MHIVFSSLRLPRRNQRCFIVVVFFLLIPIPFILTIGRHRVRKDQESKVNTPRILSDGQKNGSEQNVAASENNRLLDKLQSEQSGPWCVDLRKPTESGINRRHAYWQAQEVAEDAEDIVVYSAFYDDRQIGGLLPWIRIFGVRRKSSRPLWCYLWYSEFDVPIVTRTDILASGMRNRYVKNRMQVYTLDQYSCQLTRTDSLPAYVSLTTRPCTNSTIFLPVQHSPRSKVWRHEFSICLLASFGYYPTNWIIEWIELNSMFGVTKIDIYNVSLDGRMDAVFDYYRKRGIVEVRQLPSAIDDYSENGGLRLVGSASLNDCMFRNMYTTRFLVEVDFDEIIVPRVHATYSKMLRAFDESIGRQVPFHSYLFRNAYFFHYFPEDVSQPADLKTLRMRRRAPPLQFTRQTKAFVDPRQCRSLWSHYCVVRFDKTKPLALDVNTSFALLHHYRRQCPLNKTECADLARNMVVDDVMLNYKTELVERVSRVRKDMGL